MVAARRGSKMQDIELFRALKQDLFTAVVGDVLDVMGYRNQFLPPEVKPLTAGTKIAGRAMPVLEADYLEGAGHGPLADKPFGIMFEALDDLNEHEIYIASGSTFSYALWGGLMSTRAKSLQAAGAILNGYVRDVAEIERLDFSVFSRGTYAQDQGVRGKVLDYRVPIQFGQTVIKPGDILFGDDEGVIVIPADIAAEAIEKALEKAQTENLVADAIAKGMSAQEAWDTFGVM